MIPRLELERAIGVHAMWRSQLKTALEAGRATASVAFIHRDDRCEFGEWLLSAELSSSDKATGHYETVSRLHAEFHAIAAQLVDLARSGKRLDTAQSEALELVFQEASLRLIAAMEGWHASLD